MAVKKLKRRARKSKIYFLLIAAVLLLVVVASCVFMASRLVEKRGVQTTQTKQKGYDAYAKIAKSDIEMRGYLWEPGLDQDSVPVIALVHIDSIDGGRNYSPIYERYVLSETYGKLTVLEVYKGDVRSGQQLSYSRSGGIITKEMFQAALDIYQKDDQYYLHGSPPAAKKYIHEKVVDDIDVEVGKDYLAFMIPASSKDGKRHEYTITGAQFGFREAKGSGADATILNTATGKWESLSSVVKLSN